jgi:hypothetical protein
MDHECWQKGHRTLTYNICTALRQAQEPVTRENVLAFVTSLPRTKSDLVWRKRRGKYCYRCLKKAKKLTKGTKDEKQIRELGEYFTLKFATFGDLKQGLLMDPLIGILSALSLDETTGFYQRLTRMHAQPAKN